MPSPDDKVTIADASQASGLPKRILQSWCDMGHLPVRGKVPLGTPGGRQERWFYWRDVEPLIARYRPGGTTRGGMMAVCPTGYMLLDEVMETIGWKQEIVRRLVKQGHLDVIKVPMNGVTQKRHYVFYSAESVASYLQLRKAKDGDPAAPVRPLIAADNTICLKARRELLEKRGISVASARKCG